jgi:hypothetical protein
MANALYTKAKQGLIDGSIDLDTDTIKAVLVDSAYYTPNLATDQYLSSIASAARVATSGALSGISVTDGVFDAADLTISAVTGATFEYVVLIKDTGAEATSRLILLIDTATGLPCTPGGADIAIQWANDADRIFKLN